MRVYDVMRFRSIHRKDLYSRASKMLEDNEAIKIILADPEQVRQFIFEELILLIF